MDNRNPFLLILFSMVLVLSIPVISAESMPDSSSSGVILSLSPYINTTPGESVSALDIIPLLNQSPETGTGVPASVSLMTVKSGESLSPNAIRPGNEVIYILEGTAEIRSDDNSTTASAGDTILVPAGSVLMVTNTGSQPLRFFSVLSREEPGTDSAPRFIIRQAGTVTPLMFGNVSSKDQFEVTRILSPFEEPLPLSFDLAIARLPAGNIIADHFLESGEIGYVLSGEGNLSISCIPGRITPGDLFYVPPGEVQGFEADEDLSCLLITDPFYISSQDHLAENVC